jgi:hypothetical protein
MLDIKRVELPLDQVRPLFRSGLAFGTSRGVRKFVERMNSGLARNTAGKVEPVGFCIAMYGSLTRMQRQEAEQAIAAFPSILRRIEETGGDAPAFVEEVRKFTAQFRKDIKVMR